MKEEVINHVSPEPEDTETKVLEKLKSDVPIQTSLQESDKRVNDKATVVNMTSSVTILPLLLILTISSSYTMVHANNNEIRKTERKIFNKNTFRAFECNEHSSDISTV